MRYLFIPLLALLTLGSCNKEIAFNCQLYPTLVLQPDGYTYAEWDTLEIRTYDANGNQLNDSVTFYPIDLQDVFTINPTFAYNPDVSITIVATGDVHWLRDVQLTQATTMGKEKRGVAECYNGVNYNINGETKSYNKEALITQPLKKP